MAHQDLRLNGNGLSFDDDAAIGFSSQTVAPALIKEILEVAKRSPSGVNSQPWSVYVAQTRTLASLSGRALVKLASLANAPVQEAEFLGRLDTSEDPWLRLALDAGKARDVAAIQVKACGDTKSVDAENDA